MSHFTSLLPAMPGPRPSAALYSGPRESPMLARPTWPPSPGHCVCVCVGCVLCAVPVDMFLAFGSAVVRYSVASAFCCFVRCCTSVLGFGSDCSCSSLLAQPHSSTLCSLLCVVPVACGFAFADACGSLSVVPPHHTTSIHHTPHHAISTHLIHHKPRIPTIFTTTHYHSFLSTQVWDGVQFTVCLGCTACA